MKAIIIKEFGTPDVLQFTDVETPVAGERKIKSHVFATLDFSEMAKAHELMESGRTVGKIVLVIK